MTVTQVITNLCLNEIEEHGELTDPAGRVIVPYKADFVLETVLTRVTHRRRPLQDRYVIQWDKRRPIPSYAQNFCAALAAYMRDVLPITRPL